MTNSPINRRSQGHDPLLNFAPIISLKRLKTSISNLVLILIMASISACVIDYAGKGMCSGPRDLFKYPQISDNIPKMVQDTESYNGTLIRSRTRPIEWRYYQ